MARLRRNFFEGTPVHVVFRGNERQAIFRRDADPYTFMSLLKERVLRYDIGVHAYVFMTNHVHLLVTPATAGSLPGLFRSLGASYVWRFNKDNDRTGGLWEDRYKTIHVEDDHHFLNCMRYVELNPVRARMVDSPDRFRWSSFAANALGRKDELITPHPTFLQLGDGSPSRLAAYRALFDPVVDEAVANRIRRAVKEGWAYGNDSFLLRTGLALGLKSKLARWDGGSLLKPDLLLKIAA